MFKVLIGWYGYRYREARREKAQCRAMDVRDDLMRVMGWAMDAGHYEALGALKERRERGASYA